MQARRNWGSPGWSPPRFLLTCIFHELKKIVLRWKIAQNSKLVETPPFGISIITFDLDTRDSILSVINCERFSHFLPFTHYNTKEDTIHAIFCRNAQNQYFIEVLDCLEIDFPKLPSCACKNNVVTWNDKSRGKCGRISEEYPKCERFYKKI